MWKDFLLSKFKHIQRSTSLENGIKQCHYYRTVVVWHVMVGLAWWTDFIQRNHFFLRKDKSLSGLEKQDQAFKSSVFQSLNTSIKIRGLKQTNPGSRSALEKRLSGCFTAYWGTEPPLLWSDRRREPCWFHLTAENEQRTIINSQLFFKKMERTFQGEEMQPGENERRKGMSDQEEEFPTRKADRRWRCEGFSLAYFSPSFFLTVSFFKKLFSSDLSFWAMSFISFK